MKSKVYGLYALAAGIVLSGISIGNGEAIGQAIAAYARNPSLQDRILEILRTGILVNFIPFVLFILFLIVISCVCLCTFHFQNYDNKWFSSPEYDDIWSSSPSDHDDSCSNCPKDEDPSCSNCPQDKDDYFD